MNGSKDHQSTSTNDSSASWLTRWDTAKSDNKTWPVPDSEPPPWFVSMGEGRTKDQPPSASKPSVASESKVKPEPSDSKAPATPKVNTATTASGVESDVGEIDTEWLKLAEDDFGVVIQCIGLGSSLVTLGAGLDVRSITPGFDTCLVEMKNLPLRATAIDIESLLTQQGARRRTFRIVGTQFYGEGSQRAVLLAQKDVARKLATKLDGKQFRGNVTEFNVAGYNALPGVQSIMPNILTISWESPPMVAYLSYHDPREAHRFAEQLNKEGFGGHKLEAHIVTQPSGLQTETMVKTSRIPSGLNCFQLHSRSKAQSIVVRSEFDTEESIAAIQQFLGLGAEFPVFHRTISCAGKWFDILNITFKSWKHVKRAHDLLSGRRVKPNYPILRCYLPFNKSLRFAAYIPLEPSFAQLWDSIPEQQRKDLPMSQMHSNWGCIPPVNDNPVFNSLSARVAKISDDEGNDLSYWHWACSSPRLLHDLHSQGIPFVELCWMTRTLKVFAEDQVTLDTAVQAVLGEATASVLVQRVITTDRRLMRSLQATGALAMLKQKFSTHGLVSLDISSSHPILKHSGPPSMTMPRRYKLSLEAGRKFLSEKKAQIETAQRSIHEDNLDTSCPVCLDDFSDPETSLQRLTCGHVYCTPCLQQYITTAPERNKFPLVCIGDEDRCQTKIHVPLIQSLLDPKQFGKVVEKVLSVHVEKRPDQFKYCLSTDCSQLYQCTPTRSTSGSDLAAFCPSCFMHTCTGCQKTAHPGLTCAERRERDPSEHDALNTEWASSNGAKRCPACQVWIQKTEGCNHVTCRCGAHICWMCGASFRDANETYRHLRSAHPEQTLLYGMMQAAGRGVPHAAFIGYPPQYPFAGVQRARGGGGVPEHGAFFAQPVQPPLPRARGFGEGVPGPHRHQLWEAVPAGQARAGIPNNAG
ncbi:hypothetical protein M378DRAFT_7316 [Amanita muscaria Koide BX008]|uniref:RING-type domain-containing protein n=1 Tax=Amanita muscaria (strain Koide BX008) TaxID=946122 RepID=A0A0C2X824_AMAMK|nr:hypothetical protein M378DRAFT_7316 [Amanita muscaria Koide BX008]